MRKQKTLLALNPRFPGAGEEHRGDAPLGEAINQRKITPLWLKKVAPHFAYYPTVSANYKEDRVGGGGGQFD